MAESRRILSDAPPARPEPAPAPVREVHIPASDPVREWAEEADAFERKCEAHRARLKREERDAERARSTDWAAYIDAHIERRLAEHHEQFSELAKASAEFSDKVLQALDRLDGLFAQLSTKMTELRAADDLHRRGVIDMPSPLMRRVN